MKENATWPIIVGVINAVSAGFVSSYRFGTTVTLTQYNFLKIL